MISLASDCLLFQLANGESVPFSAEMISVEVSGDSAGSSNRISSNTRPTRSSITSRTTSAARRSPSPNSPARWKKSCAASASCRPRRPEAVTPRPPVLDADLLHWRANPGWVVNCFSFPACATNYGPLRSEPRLVRFHGLRGCVKQLAGARRWSPRCQTLQVQIVEYLRECLSAETRAGECALLVD